MEKLPKVLVIMSTYNGEKYLREQIDSILVQRDVDVTLYISDDCSKDGTQEIIKEYEKKYKNIILHINEKNKNFTYNFLDSLFEFKDSEEYDYFAFADQDDYWVDDKLITAVNKIKEIGKCTLYSSNLKVVDKELNYLDRNTKPEWYKFHPHDPLFGCPVTGCTAVFDGEFKNLVTKYYPEQLVYHDYWVGLIAVFCKNANYYLDMNPNHILYRQHGNNVIGSQKNPGLINKLKNMLIGLKQNFHILRLLLKYYGEGLSQDDKIIIERFLDYKRPKNKRYLFKNLQCSRLGRVKIKLLLNRYKEKNLEEM